MTSLADALSMPIPAASSASPLSASQNQQTQNVESSINTDSSTAQAPPSAAATRNPPVFEFTKRKRWADLLVTELSEAIIFVLSPAGKVWYCGAAVAELLGWKDEDVVDREFSEYINQDDIGPFQTAFQQCIHHRSELLTYIRLRCKPASASHSVVPQDFQATSNAPVKEVLFEIKGYPHFVPDMEGMTECKCFFIMAKPYPSRNTAMLNTFLELKMENQRLEERLVQLRALAENGSSPITTPTTTSSQHTFSSFPHSTYPATSQQQSPYGSATHPPSQAYGNLPPPPEPTSFYSGSYEELLPSPSNVRFENMFTNISSQQQQTANASGAASVGAGSGSSGDGDDDASARKKLKKSYGLEQYVCVTCGRTDSPEWRKGPNGPKTLCNACGLRWAKTVKTRKDATAAAGAGEA